MTPTPPTRSLGSLLRTAAHAALALAPNAVKQPVYRHLFGFKIGKGAKIGVSMLDVGHLELDEGARIGHGNLLVRTARVRLGKGATIGHLNVLRGGDEIRLDDFATVLRLNVLNSIPDNDAVDATDPRLHLAAGAYVVSGHRLDFTDRITLGKNVIVAGRGSSFWTHHRQSAGPIDIGDFSFVGSEVRVAPGASVGPYTIVGMGSVLQGGFEEGHAFVGGVPARPVRRLAPEDERRLRKPSRREIPEGLL